MVQATHGAAVLQLRVLVHGPLRELIRAGFILPASLLDSTHPGADAFATAFFQIDDRRWQQQRACLSSCRDVHEQKIHSLSNPELLRWPGSLPPCALNVFGEDLKLK